MFTVGIIGRPNVGKSSLFNALLRRRRAIVLDMPGTTMDEVAEKVLWFGTSVQMMDSQGVFDAGDVSVIESLVSKSDVCLMVVDVSVGVTPFDEWIAKELHKWGGKVKLLGNKVDRVSEPEERAFLKLGFGAPIYTSVTQHFNLAQVRQWCVDQAAAADRPLEANEPPVVAYKGGERPVSVALVGRPNVGKSTLMNRLCQTKVSNVSATPHTTRDPVTYELITSSGVVKFVDTAGIRRQARKKQKVEEFSIGAARNSIKKADVVLLLVNCAEAVTDQDMRLLSLVTAEGKPTMVLLNFWDALDYEGRKHFLEYSEFTRVLKNFPLLQISGLKGQGTEKILPKVFHLFRGSQKRISTGQLNRVVENIVRKNPPPARGSKNFNILYASQVDVRPPTFVLFMNRKEALPKSYHRYVETQLKDQLRLDGQTIRVHFRSKDSQNRNTGRRAYKVEENPAR